jgi:aspartate-semialdehyde dehydrogenase
MKYRVAVVGATGLVGQEFIKILEQRRFPVEPIGLLASDHTAGKKRFVDHHELEVKETTAESFHGTDVALFSAGLETSRRLSPVALQSGAAVIDNSAEWGMDPSVPVVVWWPTIFAKGQL